MTSDAPPAPGPRRLLVSGTLIAACLALAATWLFVLRPAASTPGAGVSVLDPADAVNGGGNGSGRGSGGDGAVAEVGRPVPEIALAGLDGDPVTTADLTGRVIVMNFWASNCAPCVKEMPLLESGSRRHPDVRFLGVDTLESPDAGRGMIERTGVTYARALDPDGVALARMGGVQLPHTVVVDADGVVTAVHASVVRSDDELDALIATATGGSDR